VIVRDRNERASNEAGVAQILILILVVLAIIALTIWIVQQIT
jgi:flagellar biogenesis protein FliO